MTKVNVFIIIAAVLAAVIAVGFFFTFKSAPESLALPSANVPSQKMSEPVPAPVEKAVPQTNPFEEAKTNPFKDIKTNPFE